MLAKAIIPRITGTGAPFGFMARYLVAADHAEAQPGVNALASGCQAVGAGPVQRTFWTFDELEHVRGPVVSAWRDVHSGGVAGESV